MRISRADRRAIRAFTGRTPRALRRRPLARLLALLRRGSR